MNVTKANVALIYSASEKKGDEQSFICLVPLRDYGDGRDKEEMPWLFVTICASFVHYACSTFGARVFPKEEQMRRACTVSEQERDFEEGDSEYDQEMNNVPI
jgi:hypothetical protein